MNKMKRLFMLVTAVIQIGTGSPTCNSNQKMRHDRIGNNICCYTVTCTQGQKFAFCDNDQGHDTCTNCPENSYHLDTIDTSIMTSELDPCIPKPTCEQPEVKLENGKCVCDRGRGYFGSDFNNCMLAEMVCSSPGFELRDNGKCEPCDEDFFKPEASAEHICRRKSHCHESQEIANDGSSTVDRSCKARTLRNLSPVKPTTEHHDSNTNQTIKNQENSEVVIGISICTTILVVIVIALVVIVKITKKEKSLRICLCIRNWSINCHIYEKTTSKDVDNNKTYDEVRSLSNKSISNTYEETCILMSDNTEQKSPKNITDKNYYENTSGNEMQDSISEQESKNLHLAEIHQSPDADQFLQRFNISTESNLSVDLNSSSSSNSSDKPQQIHTAINETKKKSQHRYEKTMNNDENRINAEYMHTTKAASSDTGHIKWQTQQSVRDNPYVDSTKTLVVDIAMEGGNLCAEKTSVMPNETEEKAMSKENKVNNPTHSDKKETSKYENLQRKNIVTTMRHIENTENVLLLRETRAKPLPKIDKHTQSTVNNPLNILEDESIPDPYTRRRIDFLRHAQEVGIDDLGLSKQETDKRSSHAFNIKNQQQKIDIKDRATNARSSVATVKPRLRRKEKDPNNPWTTHEHHLAVTHPENQDGLRKVATSNAPRPAESEILDNMHLKYSANTSQEERSDDTESSQSSEQSTYDPYDETVLKYLPPVDSVDFHST